MFLNNLTISLTQLCQSRLNKQHPLYKSIFSCNIIILALSLISFPYVFVFYPFSAILGIGVFIIICFYCLSLGLNWFAFHNSARILFMFVCCFAAFLYASTFGKGLGIQVLFIVFTVMPNLICAYFEKSLRLLLSFVPISFFLILVGVDFSNAYIGIPTSNQFVSWVYPINFILVSFLLYLMMRYFSGAYEESEQKLMEYNHELQDAYEQLEELNGTLLNTNKELQQSSKELDSMREEQFRMRAQVEYVHLIRNLSHEIKNPIHMIRGSAEVVYNMKDLNDKKVKSYMSAILDTVDSLRQIVIPMMDYGREVFKRSPEYINVRGLLEQIFYLVEASCAQKNIELLLECDAGLSVFIDKHQIGLALINLLSNAEQFTPKGGRILIAANPVTAHKEFDDRSMVKIVIQDSGMGIPKDKLENIFKPNFSVRKSKHNFGLGLSIVYESVQENNGWIDVESIVDVGTTFSLYLPVESVTIADNQKGENEERQSEAPQSEQLDNQSDYDLDQFLSF